MKNVFAQITSFINKYFWFFLILSMVIALFLSQFSLLFFPYIEEILGIMLFCAFLKTDWSVFVNTLKKPIIPIIFSVFKLFIVPILFWYATPFLPPYLRLGLLLIISPPQGVATPSFLDLIGGNLELGISSLIISYFITPFSIVLIFKFLAGKTLALSYQKMFWTLLTLIFIPMLLAQIVRAIFKNKIEKGYDFFSFISVIMMLLLTMGSFASRAEKLKSDFLSLLFPLFIISAGFILLGFLGWLFSLLIYKKPTSQEKITFIIASLFTNNTIAVVLADKFFNDKIFLLTILAIIPWKILPGPVKYIYYLMKKKENKNAA
jgi:predicted Na+-dependent transporter